jgi:hypothetical protein
MDQPEAKAKLYVVVARYIARRGGNWDSSIVPVGEYETFAEAESVAAKIIPPKLAKRYTPKEGYILAEIRIELYRKREKGEYRLRLLSFDVKPTRKPH